MERTQRCFLLLCRGGVRFGTSTKKGTRDGCLFCGDSWENLPSPWLSPGETRRQCFVLPTASCGFFFALLRTQRCFFAFASRWSSILHEHKKKAPAMGCLFCGDSWENLPSPWLSPGWRRAGNVSSSQPRVAVFSLLYCGHSGVFCFCVAVEFDSARAQKKAPAFTAVPIGKFR